MFLLCLFQLFAGRRTEENRPRCWVGVKVFGNELSAFTCEDLYNQMNQLSLSAAGLAVKLLKVYRRYTVVTVANFVLPSHVHPHSCFLSQSAPLPLCPPGSWGSAEPSGRADDGGAGFTVSVRFARQTGHQHDLAPFAASERQHQLQGYFSLLPDWTHQTQVFHITTCNRGYNIWLQTEPSRL